MGRTRKEKILELSRTTGESTAKQEGEGDEARLYGVAMLKVAMELKKPHPALLEEVIHRVLSKMNLSRDAFQKHLESNVELLRAFEKRGR